MTITGNNVITLRKLTSKVTAEKGLLLFSSYIFRDLNIFYKWENGPLNVIRII